MNKLGLAGVLGLLGGLALLGLVPAGPGAEDRPAAAERAALPDDLAAVPRESLGLVSLRLSDLWKSALGQALRERMRKEGKGEELADFEKNAEKGIGVPIDQVERLTMVMVDNPQTPLLALAASKPVDRKKVLQSLAPEAKEKKHGKHTLYSNDRNSVCFVSERAFLSGKADTVKEALDRTGTGTMDQPLGVAAKKHAVVLAVNPPALLKLVPGELPPPVAPFKALTKAKVGVLTVDLGDRAEAVLNVRFGSGEDAKSAEKAAQALLKMAQEALSGQLRALETSEKMHKVVEAGRLLQQVLKEAKLEQAGDVVRGKAEADNMDKAAGLLIDMIQQVRTAAARSQSANNLKQIGIAMHTYHDKYGHFPPAATYDKDGKPLLSWRVLILPFLEQNELYKEFKLDEPWDSEHNKKLLARMPKTYDTPSEKKERNHTFIQVFVGKMAAFEGKTGRKIPEFTDGTSNTILVVETEKEVPWTKPADLPFDPDKPLPKLGGVYTNGFNALFADGSVRFISQAITEKTLRAVITRNGGEVIGDDF
jgi:prepilin-type processing-associated H-X9-DG protein